MVYHALFDNKDSSATQPLIEEMELKNKSMGQVFGAVKPLLGTFMSPIKMCDSSPIPPTSNPAPANMCPGYQQTMA